MKKLLVLTSIFMIVALLNGCGGHEAAKTASGPTSTPTPVKEAKLVPVPQKQ